MQQQPQRPPPIIPIPGFIIKTHRTVTKAKVFINVCGHPVVEPPIGYSGEPITPDRLDQTGSLDNIQIPIAVGCPRASQDSHGEPSTTIDVLFNDTLLAWVLKHNNNAAISDRAKVRLCGLCHDWIEKECDMFLERTSAKVIQGKYKGEVGTPFVPADMVSQRQQHQRQHQQPDSEPPLAVPSQQGAPQQAKKSAVGIEVLPEKLEVKKGFLNNNAGALYPEGTTKEGVLPEGAGDPLGHIPKSLRERAKIIDTSKFVNTPAPPPPPPEPRVKDVSVPEVVPDCGLISSGMCGEFAKLLDDLRNAEDAQEGHKAKLIEEYNKKRKPWPYTVDVVDKVLVTQVQVPGDVDVSSLDVNVESDFVDFGNFVIPFGHRVDANEASAKFVKKTKVYTIRAPLL